MYVATATTFLLDQQRNIAEAGNNCNFGDINYLSLSV